MGNEHNNNSSNLSSADPLVFKIASEQITDVWMDSANAVDDNLTDATLAGLVFILGEVDFAGIKREPQVLDVGQLHLVDGQPIVTKLNNGGTVKHNAEARRITTSASSNSIDAITTPAATEQDYLYQGLEFYKDTDLIIREDHKTTRDFVFFPSSILQELCYRFQHLALAGTKVSYGSMMEIPEGDTYAPTTEYFTMKLEGLSEDGAQAGAYPGISLGVVCPPKWYTSGGSIKK